MITVWTRDSVALRLEVAQEDGTPFDLTGATVAAAAKQAAGSVVAAQVTVADAALGLADLRWTTGTLTPGNWSVQAWVTKAGQVQTVLDSALTVRASIS